MRTTPSPLRTASGHLLLLGALLVTLIPGVSRASFTAISTNPLGQNGMGFGVSWCDVDLDGDQDLYLSYDGPDFLLRNDGGSFTDVSAPPLDEIENGGSAVWGDYDNDGDPDLYLVNYLGTNRLFRNDRAAGFTDATAMPLDDHGPGQAAAWADYDLDGDLDLYLVHYGTPNRMFRNDGAEGFVDATAGPLADAGWGLAATWGDYDNDGDPDLYVTNDGPNRLLRNDGSGAFTRIPGLAIEDGGAGQGAAWGDYDRDGDLDLYVANWGTPNKLIRNDGGDQFAQVTTGALGDRGNTTGVAFGDYDLDGDLDLYMANYGSPNRLLRNDGGDLFSAITDGPLGDDGNGTAVAWCDYDRDGDLDLYLVNDGQKNVLMRNDQVSGNHWLELEMKGRVSNRSAIGTRVRVVAGTLSMIGEVSGGSGYLSQNSLPLEFGLAGHVHADSIFVAWPSGYVEVYRNVAADRKLVITELDVVAVEDVAPAAPPLRLGPPSPNPSGGRVRLDVSLPVRARVRLEVFDVQGRRVASLMDGLDDAGVHPVTWDSRDDAGRRVAAGVYWARFEALGEVWTRAIVIAR
jgi:hypothetical protein